MLGLKERKEKKERKRVAAAVRAANQRSSYWDAVWEVLKSQTPTTLWVGAIKIQGGKGECSISDDDHSWFGAEYLLSQVLLLREVLGKNYKVEADVSASVSSPSFGLAMDMISGHSIPRTHAMNYDTMNITVASEKDLEKYRHELHGHCYYSIWVTKR